MSYPSGMPKMIRIRNVPDEVHRRLKARAALAGLAAGAGAAWVSNADGSLSRSYNEICFENCDLDVTETFSNGGMANVFLQNFGAPAGSLMFGDVSITGGEVKLDAFNFLDISGGAIALTGTGMEYTVSVNGTFEGNAIDYSEAGNAGGAVAELIAAEGGAVRLNGAVDLEGRGLASLHISADEVALRDVTAVASAASF
jgi:hypothetical protein